MAVFDHGAAPPDVSDRVFRFRYLADRIEGGLLALSFRGDAVPPAMTRLQAAADAAPPGLPVVVNTSLNTAGRPMVDDPRDALECFGSAPVTMLAIGPFVVRRRDLGGRAC